MKKLGIISLLSLIVMSMSFCRKDINGPNNNVFNVQPENLVALTAIFYNKDKSKQIPKIALVDFYNHKNYKIITDTTMYAGFPKFSRDKSKILFGDDMQGVWHIGPQFVLYDIINDNFEHLTRQENWPLWGVKPVWNYDDTGFYYTIEGGQGYKDVRFYRIDDKYFNFIIHKIDIGVYPIGLKGQDTLIVFSNDIIETGQEIGYYFMDLNGNYLSMINNPNFEFITSGGIRKKGQWNLNWNEKYGLFVYTEDDSTIQGYRISVTNLDGSYYRRYTSGQYFDDFPVWGPEGKYILFNRADDIRTTGIDYKLMIIYVQSGEIREFLKPGDITGAIKYVYPDY